MTTSRCVLYRYSFFKYSRWYDVDRSRLWYESFSCVCLGYLGVQKVCICWKVVKFFLFSCLSITGFALLHKGGEHIYPSYRRLACYSGPSAIRVRRSRGSQGDLRGAISISSVSSKGTNQKKYVEIDLIYSSIFESWFGSIRPLVVNHDSDRFGPYWIMIRIDSAGRESRFGSIRPKVYHDFNRYF